ncbi:hypothetical protein E2C01_027170 [Portunus trituberculatus]|uniref:Uncharacterized protein n=1 Tax=Portunus trituberculatus TaxID=210409 RepID=A0A5B7EKU2_PORTR|nr:hypothetical protein [Portunus trituberculatus]
MVIFLKATPSYPPPSPPLPPPPLPPPPLPPPPSRHQWCNPNEGVYQVGTPTLITHQEAPLDTHSETRHRYTATPSHRTFRLARKIEVMTDTFPPLRLFSTHINFSSEREHEYFP